MEPLRVINPEEKSKVCPTCKQELPQKQKIEDLRQVIVAWKLIRGIPREGERGKAWDRINWPRYSKTAKSLLEMFGGLENAVEAIEYIYNKTNDEGLTCSFETIVKRSDLFYEEMQRRGI